MCKEVKRIAIFHYLCQLEGEKNNFTFAVIELRKLFQKKTISPWIYSKNYYKTVAL
jgi:hypothetical protein